MVVPRFIGDWHLWRSVAAGIFLIAIWTLAGAHPQSSSAAGVSIGLDFNPTGTPANGVYNPSSLPTFETCREVAIGSQVSIDVCTP